MDPRASGSFGHLQAAEESPRSNNQLRCNTASSLGGASLVATAGEAVPLLEQLDAAMGQCASLLAALRAQLAPDSPRSSACSPASMPQAHSFASDEKVSTEGRWSAASESASFLSSSHFPASGEDVLRPERRKPPKQPRIGRLKFGQRTVVKREYLAAAEAAQPEPMSLDDVTNAFEGTARKSVFGTQSVPWSDDGEGDRGRKCCLFMPHGPVRVLQDVLSLLALTFDLTVQPVIVAWDNETPRWMEVMNIAMLFFWLLDMALSFSTAIFIKGVLVTSRRRIALHYLGSNFAVDATVLIVDATTQILGSSSSSSAFLRVFKFSRMFRLMRLYRAASAADVLKKVISASSMDTINWVLGVLAPFLYIIAINHLLACLWYAVGTSLNSDTGAGWLDTPLESSSEGGATMRTSGFWFQYTTCYHWSLSQMTPGAVQVHPLNTGERLVNILCLLGGMVIFSTIISSLSAKLSETRVLQRHRRETLKGLTSFLRANGVAPQFAVELQRAAAETMRKVKPKPCILEDIAIVRELPTSMQLELRAELCEKRLTPMFFRLWRSIDQESFAVLCQAITSQAFVEGDVIFARASPSDAALVLSQGRAMISVEGSSNPIRSCSLLESRQTTPVGVGSFLSELALWLDWRHTSNCLASAGTVALCIQAEKFGAIALGDCSISHLMLELGLACHRWCQQNPSLMSDAINLGGSGESSEEGSPTASLLEVLLPSLSKVSREIVSNGAVFGAGNRLRGRRLGEAEACLGDEVPRGTVTLVRGDDGSLLRIASVHCVDIAAGLDLSFAVLGPWSPGEGLRVAVRLPGTKLRGGETDAAALARVMGGLLAPFCKSIATKDSYVDVIVRSSARKRLLSKYTRTVHQASLREDVALSELDLPGVADCGKSVGLRTLQGLPASRIDLSGLFLLVDGQGKLFVCSWLSQEQLEEFTSPAGEQELQAYLKHLAVPHSAIEKALQIQQAALAGSNTNEAAPSGATGSDFFI